MLTTDYRARWVGLVALVLLGGSWARSAEPGAPRLAPKVLIAFLGVGVRPVSSADGKDLGLAKGVGLAVRTVEEMSPAQNRLNVGDILVRLDDQILIHPYQLAVLVRTYKPGTEVKMTLLRGGNELAIPVILGEREPAPLPFSGWGQPLGPVDAEGGGVQPENAAAAIAVNGGTMTINVAGIADQPGGVREQVATVVAVAVADDQRRTATTVENGTSYSLTTTNGHSAYTVTAPDAKVLFAGAVNTDEEKARVPEAYRARLAALAAPPALPAAPGAAPPPPP